MASANLTGINNTDFITREYFKFFSTQVNKITYLKLLVRNILYTEYRSNEETLEYLARSIGEANLGISLYTLFNFREFAQKFELALLKNYGSKTDTVYSIYKIFKNPPKELVFGNEFIRIPYMSRKQFELFMKYYKLEYRDNVNPYVSNDQICYIIGNYIMTDNYIPQAFDLSIYASLFNLKLYIFTSDSKYNCISGIKNIDEYLRVFLYYDLETNVYSLANLKSTEYNISYSITRSFKYYNDQKEKKNTDKIFKEFVLNYIFIDYIMCGLSDQLF